MNFSSLLKYLFLVCFSFSAHAENEFHFLGGEYKIELLVKDPDERYPVTINLSVDDNLKIVSGKFNYPLYKCSGEIKSQVSNESELILDEVINSGIDICENSAYVFSFTKQHLYEKDGRGIKSIKNIYEGKSIDTVIQSISVVSTKMSNFKYKHKIYKLDDILRVESIDLLEEYYAIENRELYKRKVKNKMIALMSANIGWTEAISFIKRYPHSVTLKDKAVKNNIISILKKKNKMKAYYSFLKYLPASIELYKMGEDVFLDFLKKDKLNNFDILLHLAIENKKIKPFNSFYYWGKSKRIKKLETNVPHNIKNGHMVFWSKNGRELADIRYVNGDPIFGYISGERIISSKWRKIRTDQLFNIIRNKRISINNNNDCSYSKNQAGKCYSTAYIDSEQKFKIGGEYLTIQISTNNESIYIARSTLNPSSLYTGLIDIPSSGVDLYVSNDNTILRFFTFRNAKKLRPDINIESDPSYKFLKEAKLKNYKIIKQSGIREYTKEEGYNIIDEIGKAVMGAAIKGTVNAMKSANSMGKDKSICFATTKGQPSFCYNPSVGEGTARYTCLASAENSEHHCFNDNVPTGQDRDLCLAAVKRSDHYCYSDNIPAGSVRDLCLAAAQRKDHYCYSDNIAEGRERDICLAAATSNDYYCASL